MKMTVSTVEHYFILNFFRLMYTVLLRIITRIFTLDQLFFLCKLSHAEFLDFDYMHGYISFNKNSDIYNEYKQR